MKILHYSKKTAAAVAVLSMLTLAFASGCGSGKGGTTTTTGNTAATRLAPATLFGSWRLAGTSGGISGGGFGVPDRSVTFEQNGTLTQRTGTVNIQHNYRVERTQTNLSADPLLVIVNATTGERLAIIQCHNTQLTLADEGVSEGYDYVYDRETAVK